MPYLIAFAEGGLSFISPCLLPLLPVYVFYLSGGTAAHDSRRTIKNALAFVCGFSLVYMTLGLFAGAIGSFMERYQMALNLVSGTIVIILGASVFGLFNLPFISNHMKALPRKQMRLFPSFVFGLAFSVHCAHCIMVFLGSTLMLASQQGSSLVGMLMLLCYSAGIGIPFLISAALINYLKKIFSFISRHYKVINMVSGGLLVVLGILMMSGLLEHITGH